MFITLLLLNIILISAFNPSRNMQSKRYSYNPKNFDDYYIPKSVERIFQSQKNPKIFKEKITRNSKKNSYKIDDSIEYIIFDKISQDGPIFYN